MHLSCNTIVAKSSLAASDIMHLFSPAFPYSDKLTPGNPPPLKGAKLWLHLSCHQFIQISMLGYNLATSSSLLFNILYLHTVVTWHKSLMIVVNTCHISGPMHLAILVASFWKCHWHSITLDVAVFTINHSDCLVASSTFMAHESFWCTIPFPTIVLFPCRTLV